MAKVLFLTAFPPEQKRYWNHDLIDALQTSGLELTIACWQQADSALIDLASKHTHVCLLLAAYYNEEIDGFNILVKCVLPALQRSHSHIRICNAPKLEHWNSDKTYLLDLQEGGFLIPRARALKAGATYDELLHALTDFSQSLNRSPIVVKPSLGASGVGVTKIKDCEAITNDEEVALRLMHAASTNGVILQEFLSDIRTNGELSLVFIDGHLVGAALKRVDGTRQDEFRVNSEYGGLVTTVQLEDIPTAARHIGEDVVKWLERKFGVNSCAYMRLDGVMRLADGAFVLMEVECIEPSLLTMNDAAFRSRVVEAIRAMFNT